MHILKFKALQEMALHWQEMQGIEINTFQPDLQYQRWKKKKDPLFPTHFWSSIPNLPWYPLDILSTVSVDTSY